MTHRKNKGGGLALFTTLVIALFASGCGGGGGGPATSAGGGGGNGGNNDNGDNTPDLPQGATLVCAEADCGSEVLSYDNGATLVLSPESIRMQASFSPGSVLTDPQTGTGPVADALHRRNVRVGRRGDLINDPLAATGVPNRLTLGTVSYSMDAAGHAQEGDDVFCTSATNCNAIGDVNYTLGYRAFFRYPDNVLDGDKDVFTGGFTVIKTTLSTDYLVFGVGINMEHQERLSTGGNITQRYRPVEFGSFVFGTQNATASLPTSGLAAYAGFSQAYVQGSNRNYHPFDANGTQVSGGIVLNGYSAMVFSFDSNGEANFENGYIDLFGNTYTDTGADDAFRRLSRTPHAGLNGHLTLSANFANPAYTSYGDVLESRDPDDDFTSAPGFDPNDDDDRVYDIRADGSLNIRPQTALLAFRLSQNTQTTEDMLDFTMQLRKSSGGSCLAAVIDVLCYASDDSDATRAGLARFYGERVTLTSDSNNARVDVPLFVGGVWQYDGIVFVDSDTDDDGTADDPTLLDVVNLYGSFGGLIVDNPACGTDSSAGNIAC